MKDLDMADKLSEMSNDDLETHIENLFGRLIKGLAEAENRTCDAAEKGAPGAATANAFITQAAGNVRIGKGLATRAGLALPDVTVSFGGK